MVDRGHSGLRGATTTPGPSSGPRRFFWSFCDDYLELVKARAYGEAAQPGTASARAALALALSVQLRLFAPFLPFVTEEVWSWWREGSVHDRGRWPSVETELVPALAPGTEIGRSPVLDVTSEVLAAVRREKTAQKRSMRAAVSSLQVVDSDERLGHLEAGRADLFEAGGVTGWSLVPGTPPSVAVELAAEA